MIIAMANRVCRQMTRIFLAASACSLLLCACSTASMPTNTPSPFPATPTPTPRVMYCPPLISMRDRYPSLPTFLEQVSPEPESTLGLLEYDERQSTVCVVFVVEEILEPGDFFHAEDVVGRLALLIDGHTAEDLATGKEDYEDYCTSNVQMAKIMLFDEEGNVIASGPGPLGSRCWSIALEPGKHEATVRLRKTSGAVLEYTWTFTLTPPPPQPTALSHENGDLL
jgi:hypothetical protein